MGLEWEQKIIDMARAEIVKYENDVKFKFLTK
jgi:hypothetical protein